MPAGVSLVPPLLVFLLTIVAFLPSLQNGFVNWDDEAFLVNNPNYRGLGWKQIQWMFTNYYLSSCMPLTGVTYGSDYVLWGMNPLGYHLTSLLIHAANALALQGKKEEALQHYREAVRPVKSRRAEFEPGN